MLSGLQPGASAEAPREDERGSIALPSERAPIVLALPFHAEPSRLVCAVTGLHIYLETIDGAKEILARWSNPTV